MRLVGVAAGPLGASLAVSPGHVSTQLSQIKVQGGWSKCDWEFRCPPLYQIGAYLPVQQNQHILCHFSRDFV